MDSLSKLRNYSKTINCSNGTKLSKQLNNADRKRKYNSDFKKFLESRKSTNLDKSM